MRNFSFALLLAFAAVCLLAQTPVPPQNQLLTASLLSAVPADCSGNACNVISLTGDSNGCTLVKNSSSRFVRVAFGGISRRVSPGETWTVMNPFANQCLKIIVGKLTANYED